MFRTELTIAPAAGQLARTARVLTMGSCFADSIGARLVANKVETRVNPFGTVFQPLALVRLLRAAAGEEVDWQRHLVQARGRWQSYDLHGSVGADSPVELLQYIQEVVRQTGDFLRTADVVMLTLGTAWAYRLRETGELVSNCHKQPADLFVRELLTPDEIINALAETHAYLRRINPDLRFVLTVSPVRHLKDTLQLNAVSKSVLRLATHIVSDLLPGVAYFPAYELLVDDLRDYRFYASDMLHPSEVAEDYVWEKFARAYFDADFGRFRKEWAAVRQSLGHRPLHEGAPEHRQFLESTRDKLEQLSLRKVDVAAELRTVQTRLAALPIPRQPEPAVELEDDEERIDIGEGSKVSTIARVNPRESEVTDAAGATLTASQGLATYTPARAPRLSPEEFRAQRASRPERGRRDGRGKGQPEPQTENEQFQTAALTEGSDESLPLVPGATAKAMTAFEVSLGEQIDAGNAPATAANADVEAAASQEAAKKKKRRSRGGAKRTARKHALRLASEMGLTEEEAAALVASSGTGGEDAEARPENQKSSVIAKSQPVKRGGRRNDAGRVPRTVLFASSEPEAAAEDLRADTELPTPTIALPAEAPSLKDKLVTESVSASAVTDDEPATVETPSRNSRNRKKKKAARALESGANDGVSPPTPPASEQAAALPPTDTEQLSEAPEAQPVAEVAHDEQRLPVAALPVGGQTAAAVATGASAAGQPAPAGNKPARRAKSRAISGGRAEKPAVDTPIIPVIDQTVVRTQVAGGRLMGSSATLIEQVTPTPKAASAAKVPAAKAPASKAKAIAKGAAATATGPTAEPAAATAPPTITAKVPKGKAAPKPKAAPKTAAEIPTAPSAAVASDEPAATKSAPKKAAKAPAKAATAPSAPAEKAKPAAKASAKKAPATPAVPEPEAKKVPAKAKAPKAAATKATAAKPKASKKPAA